MQNSQRTYDLIQQNLLQMRTILLWGEVNDKSAQEIVERMMYLHHLDANKDITFLINSPGGHVHAGYAIYDCMQGISCDVGTSCTGMAASMGAILLSAGTKGKRKVMPNAKVMIHQPSGGIGGTHADIEIQAAELFKAKELGARQLAENCGKSVEQILADFNRDHWMDAQEAVEYGIVDVIG